MARRVRPSWLKRRQDLPIEMEQGRKRFRPCFLFADIPIRVAGAFYPTKQFKPRAIGPFILQNPSPHPT